MSWAEETGAGPLQIQAERQQNRLICLLLAVVTVVVYWRIHSFEFANLDDPYIIYQNPHVTGGLTWRAIFWGLGTDYFEYWHPLTWWSHMLDCELFGLRPGWHHLSSLAFHIANTLVLFLAFREMTGKPIRSALVAALFALHPMHVESVVWLAERKDVLSTLFWLLSIWFYARYVKGLQTSGPKVDHYYWLSLVMFGCGLASKPMVVTLPCVLLLLDYWPLNRYDVLFGDPAPAGSGFEVKRRRGVASMFLDLFREKIPFFVLAGISSYITFSNVKSAHNIISSNKFSLGLRLANVPVSYGRYLLKFVWPSNMSVFYPMPAHWPAWQVMLSMLVLLAISWGALARLRSAPYLAVGWCIFLGVIVPTISLVPVGYQSIADRYTYLAYIGLFAAGVWAVADILERWKAGAALPTGLASVVLLAFAVVTWVQIGYWQNNFTLWPHCLAVTEDNFLANYNLGYAEQNIGRLTNAIEHYTAALKIRPDDWQANMNMGRALAATDRMSDSTNYFIKAIQSQPDSPLPHRNLGMALTELRVDLPRAVTELNESIRLDPGDGKTRVALGKALVAEGNSIEAIACFSDVLRAAPGSPDVMYYLGKEQLKVGQIEDAIANLNRAVQLDPSLTDAQAQLDAAMKMHRGNQLGKPVPNPPSGTH